VEHRAAYRPAASAAAHPSDTRVARACNFQCQPDPNGALCGTDGVTYQSHCELRRTICELHAMGRGDTALIRVAHGGPCTAADIAQAGERWAEDDSSGSGGASGELRITEGDYDADDPEVRNHRRAAVHSSHRHEYQPRPSVGQLVYAAIVVIVIGMLMLFVLLTVAHISDQWNEAERRDTPGVAPPPYGVWFSSHSRQRSLYRELTTAAV